MSQQWYSVDEVAEQLGLHVKTVRGYIRDGRLPAARVGKQYRITRDDLTAFTGTAPEPVSRTRHVEASSIVQVDAISRDSMQRLTTMVMASLGGGQGAQPLHVQTSYDEERASLKIIVIGEADRAAELLKLIDTIAEQV